MPYETMVKILTYGRILESGEKEEHVLSERSLTELAELGAVGWEVKAALHYPVPVGITQSVWTRSTSISVILQRPVSAE